MATFSATKIIDGDTFEVNPSWKWNNQTGSIVRPTGYDAPEIGSLSGALAKDQLARLILGKQVELGAAYRIDRGRLVCDVFVNGERLSEYFSRY